MEHKTVELTGDGDYIDKADTLLGGKRFFTSFCGLSKVNMLLALLATLVLRVTPFMRTVPIAGLPDSVGSFLGAARLAGLDWPGVGASELFYGQGYYTLFSPVFSATDNPFTIWLALLLINAALMSVFSIVIYSIAVLYCKLPDKVPTALIVAFCSGTTFVDGAIPWNEVPVFFVVWVAALMLFIASNAKKKTRAFSTLGLVGILFWGMFIHARLDVLIIIIGLVALLYFCFFKVWVVSPLVFYPGIILCYFLSGVVNAYLSSVLYSGQEVTQMKNATLVPEGVLRSALAVEPFIDTTISNVYTLIFSTYGIAAVTIVLLAFFVYRICKRLFSERIRSDDGLGMPRDQLAVMLIFSICIIVTILGIYLRTSGPINAFYANKGINSRWFAYLRYYVPFYSPLILITMGFAYNNIERIRKMSLYAYGLFFALFIYTNIKVIPMLQQTVDYIRTDRFSYYLGPFCGALLGAFGTLAIIAGLFVIYYILLYKRKPLFMSVPVFIIALSMSVSNISAPLFNVVPPSEKSETSYRVLKHVEATNGLPDEIFTVSNVPVDLNLLQFLLNRYNVIQALPDEGNDDAVFVGRPSEEDAYELEKLGLILYQFPNDVDIWFRGEGMRKSIDMLTPS